MHICSCSGAKSCLTLCDPMDCSLPGSSVHGIFPARILEGVVMPSSRDRTCVSCIGTAHIYVCASVCVCVCLCMIYILHIYTHIQSPWGCKELDTTETTEQTYIHTHTHTHIYMHMYITELLCTQYCKSTILQLKKLPYACLGMTHPFTILCLQWY